MALAAAIIGLKPPSQELQQRAFAAAIGPPNENPVPRLDGEINAIKDPGADAITEVDAGQRDQARQGASPSTMISTFAFIKPM
jgi:hypothetical protein